MSGISWMHEYIRDRYGNSEPGFVTITGPIGNKEAVGTVTNVPLSKLAPDIAAKFKSGYHLPAGPDYFTDGSDG